MIFFFLVITKNTEMKSLGKHVQIYIYIDNNEWNFWAKMNVHSKYLIYTDKLLSKMFPFILP